MAEWQPTASVEQLRARAELLHYIRDFFQQRGVLEVETPLLAQGAPSEPHLNSFALPDPSGTRYLQTSPEFAMKRLLAAGSGDIYQICKSFRAGEAGARHNPEFTMLEWYRVGLSIEALMDEVQELAAGIMSPLSFPRISYRDLMQRSYDINPHSLDTTRLQELASGQMSLSAGALTEGTENMQRAFCLDLLLDQCLRAMSGPSFVYDFPACQAALAEIETTAEGDRVARRFELYIDGIEIANGYQELRDADELLRRFRADRVARASVGLSVPDSDIRLLAAMRAGLPPCAGVALGVDRLLMYQAGVADICDVLAFPWPRA